MVLLLDPRPGEEKLTLRPGEGAVVGLGFAAVHSLLSLSAGEQDQPGAVHLWPACTDGEVLAYVERHHDANLEDVETRIDLARLYARRAASGGAAAGKRSRVFLEELTDRQYHCNRLWLGLLK
jgi:hypothetical protein